MFEESEVITPVESPTRPLTSEEVNELIAALEVKSVGELLLEGIEDE